MGGLVVVITEDCQAARHEEYSEQQYVADGEGNQQDDNRNVDQIVGVEEGCQFFGPSMAREPFGQALNPPLSPEDFLQFLGDLVACSLGRAFQRR